MTNLPDNIPYDEWLKYVFDHDIPPKATAEEMRAHSEKIKAATEKIQSGEATYDDVKEDLAPPTWSHWWFEDDAPLWAEDRKPALTVDYITRAFNEIDQIATRYTDAQMNQGIQFLIDNGASSHMFALLEPSVPLEKRIACVNSFLNVYEKLYAVKCTPKLSSVVHNGLNPLNHTCYMWWDIIPFYPKANESAVAEDVQWLPGELERHKERIHLDEPILAVMEKTLQLNNEACLEGALHGLGHWHYQYHQRVETVIDRFLEQNTTMSPELREYATRAKQGYVL